MTYTLTVQMTYILDLVDDFDLNPWPWRWTLKMTYILTYILDLEDDLYTLPSNYPLYY